MDTARDSPGRAQLTGSFYQGSDQLSEPPLKQKKPAQEPDMFKSLEHEGKVLKQTENHYKIGSMQREENITLTLWREMISHKINIG